MVAYELGIHGIDVGALVRHPGAGRRLPHQDAHRPARSCRSSPTLACAWSPPAGAGGSSPPRARTPVGAPAPPPARTRRAWPRAPSPPNCGPPADYLSLMATLASRARALPRVESLLTGTVGRRAPHGRPAAHLAVPAHARARRLSLDRRGALDRHRLATVLRHPGRAAPGRLAAALLPVAAPLDGGLRHRPGRHPEPLGRLRAAGGTGRLVGGVDACSASAPA